MREERNNAGKAEAEEANLDRGDAWVSPLGPAGHPGTIESLEASEPQWKGSERQATS